MSLRWLHNPFLDPSVLLSTARLRSRPGKKTVEGYTTGARSAVERTAIPSELLSFSFISAGIWCAYFPPRVFPLTLEQILSIGTIAGHAGAPQNLMLQFMCKNQPHFFQT
ncbi:unnamed protein product [Sphagnum jensenii]|uniref:Uncharacterized protein n=1 Tax=Sphagnum jensenii TaxID=128206 RepID=A0ABP0WDW4_9BRYO